MQLVSVEQSLSVFQVSQLALFLLISLMAKICFCDSLLPSAQLLWEIRIALKSKAKMENWLLV